MTTESANVTPSAVSPAVITQRAALRSPEAIRAERRAWLILWLAFATFCVLLVSATKFTADYVSTAEVDQMAHVDASHGFVLVGSRGSDEQTLLAARPELGVGTVITPDRPNFSSVELRLFDQSKVRVLAGARLELERMEVGRFVNQHTLVLNQTAGPVRYQAAGGIDVRVPNGLVHLAPHGDYTVWLVEGDVTRVLVYEGEARIEANGAAIVVPSDHRGEIVGQQLKEFPQRQISLLQNGDFASHAENWEPRDVPNSPLDVNGQRYWVEGPEQGGESLTALRIVRESARQEHGETGLRQKLDVDVSGFRHLWLRAWVRVDSASLSGGGQLGSEYPMMMRLQYEDAVEGSRDDWVIGFYVANPENRPVPQGVLWPRGSWQPYQVDLMNTEESRVPYRLRAFEVMGQGHSYDARIADIELIGD